MGREATTSGRSRGEGELKQVTPERTLPIAPKLAKNRARTRKRGASELSGVLPTASRLFFVLRDDLRCGGPHRGELLVYILEYVALQSSR